MKSVFVTHIFQCYFRSITLLNDDCAVQQITVAVVERQMVKYVCGSTMVVPRLPGNLLSLDAIMRAAPMWELVHTHGPLLQALYRRAETWASCGSVGQYGIAL